MAAMTEGCSVCGKRFEVQFRYQMEEKDGGFAFFCSQDCHGKSMRGEDTGGVTCDACRKRFVVELVSQIVRVKNERKYACSDPCRTQLIAESNGVRLGAFMATDDARASIDSPVPPSVGPVSHARPATVVAPSPPTYTPYRSVHTAPMARPPVPMATPPGIAQGVQRPVAPMGFSSPAMSPSASIPSHRTMQAPSATPNVAQVTIPTSPSVVPTGESAAPAVDVPLAPVPRVPGTGKAKLFGPRKIAIFNHKGGTGKTTTSVSIASGLAARGLRVLLVDTDAQGNVGVSLACKAERSLYHVLVMGLRAQDAASNVRTYPGGGALDLIVANETLAAAELYLAGRQNRDRVLKDRLAGAVDNYDVVLIDCSPSLSLMNQNALVMADGILVPVACDFLSLVGVRQVIKTVKNVNSLLHHPVQIFGVLPTFYDSRARICRDAVETLKEHFGDRCLPPIRSTTKVKEAPSQGKTIYEYAADSNAADDYKRVVDYIIEGPSAFHGVNLNLMANEDDDAQAASA